MLIQKNDTQEKKIKKKVFLIEKFLDCLNYDKKKYNFGHFCVFYTGFPYLPDAW